MVDLTEVREHPNLRTVQRKKCSERNCANLRTEGKSQGRIAEDGFDPPTSGLWARHASAASLCFFRSTLGSNLEHGTAWNLKLEPSALCISFIITSVIEDEFKDCEQRILRRTSTPDWHFTDLLIADQEASIRVNTPNNNLWFCIMLFFSLQLHLITWPSDNCVCLI